MSDQYKTIIDVSESKFEVKKSRFIGLATAVGHQNAIKGFLDLVQRKHPNASHYCYGYNVGAGRKIRGYETDAGAHSAGPPMLNVEYYGFAR